MNHYSKLLKQSLAELDKWLIQQPNLDNQPFYKRLQNLLQEARDSEPQDVDRIVKIILYTITDSGPNDVLRGDFLPSFSQVVDAMQKKKKS